MEVTEALPIDHYVSAATLRPAEAEGKMVDIVSDYFLWRRALFRAFRRPATTTKRVLTPRRGYWRIK